MHKKPTLRWRTHIGDDSAFSEESITATDKILETFEERLKNTKHDQDAILAEVRDVILLLNDLNNVKYPGLIWTLEREELADFIESCAKDAGLQVKDGTDITEDWRDW
jgi:hypothetical protein